MTSIGASDYLYFYYNTGFDCAAQAANITALKATGATVSTGCP